MKRHLLTSCMCLLVSHTVWAQWSSAILFPPDARDGAFSFVINGNAYVGAGALSKDLWKFNEQSKTWTQLNNAAGGINRAFAASFEFGGFGYVVGGDSAFGESMNDVWKYDPTSDTWSKLSDFPGGKRVGMISWKVNNKIFVGGGTDMFSGSGLGTIYKDFYEYNPTTDHWIKYTDLPIGIAFASCFVIGTKAYFTCGSINSSSNTNDLYSLDIQTMQLRKILSAFPGQSRSAGVAFSINNKAYVGLGQQGFSQTYTDFYCYNPVDSSWTLLGDYPSDISGWATSFVLNGTGYVGTGLDPSTFNFQDKFYSYTPLTTGINEQSSIIQQVKVYPNPAKASIFLVGDNTIGVYKHIEAIDMEGKIISLAITDNEKVDISSLKKGIYTILLTTDRSILSQKIIVVE